MTRNSGPWRRASPATWGQVVLFSDHLAAGAVLYGAAVLLAAAVVTCVGHDRDDPIRQLVAFSIER